MAKVLLVEDDNNLREIFEMRLQAEGYQTVTASNGEEGLSVAMREKPDLIVADIMMPKLSGFDMLENLRAAPEMKDVKVIMMTALGQAEDQARGQALGVVKYLVKSQATLEDFAKVVKEVLPAGSTTTATSAPQAPNNLESENKMDDQTTNNQPAPVADSGMPAAEPTAPASNPVMGDAPTADPASTGQMSTADEQSTVNSQINDFANAPAPAADANAPAAGDTLVPGAPDMSGSTSTDAPSMPQATPPAPEAPTMPPAADQPAAPADPNVGSV